MFVLETEQKHPEVVEEPGAVYLVIGVLDVEILDGARDRAERGHVQPDRVGIEGAQPRVLPGSAGARRGGRIEVIPEIEKRAAEVVGGGHYPCPMISLWSPTLALPS